MVLLVCAVGGSPALADYEGGQAATGIRFSGNLTGPSLFDEALSKVAAFHNAFTSLRDLDPAGGVLPGDSIQIRVTRRDGTLAWQRFEITDPGSQSLADVASAISELLGAADVTPDIGPGRLLAEDLPGNELLDVRLQYSGEGDPDLPKKLTLREIGGANHVPISVKIFDERGCSYWLEMDLTRTDPLTWDLALSDVSGCVEIVDGTVTGISFLERGRYVGLAGPDPDIPAFELRFPDDGDDTTMLWLDLGTPGKYDGLTQFGGSTTVRATVVPEPITLWLLVAGAALIVKRRRTRQG